MTEKQLGQIMQSMGELKGKVDVGFLDITRRQDTANGRVTKVEGKIELIEKQQATADGRLTAYGWVFAGVVAVVGIATPFVLWMLDMMKKS